MRQQFFLLVSVVVLLTLSIAHAKDTAHPKSRSHSTHQLRNEAERSTDYWNDKAQAILAAKLAAAEHDSTNRAKNIIMFLGDGMSVHTMTAARNLMGDSSDQVSFEKLPYLGLAKSYCVNRQVADSACTATAYLSGVKGNYGTIGVNANVKRYNCTDGQNPEYFVESIAKWAQDANKDTGFVTTARVTHASPAGVYASTANRNWENDAEIIDNGCSAVDNVDIARQLVEWQVGRNLKVIMGGGRENFRNTTVNDEEGQPGTRLDGRDLIDDWLADQRSRNRNAQYVWSKKGLSLLNLTEVDSVLGLFSSSHCPYHGDLERNHISNGNPSLTDMTEAAIQIMQRNENGFFLFVEGARIDMAHHDTKARKSLEDTVEFSRAIQKALDMTSVEDTLIVVTSDHSHTMTINGYPDRDRDITGLVGTVADDGLPYTILSYANGPGYYGTYAEDAGGRTEITAKQTASADFEYMATVPLSSETHGGEDVGVFASGPYSQYFSGTYEQSNIPIMMARAAAIGAYAGQA